MLIIDPHPAPLPVLRALLSEAGHKVAHAITPRAATRILADEAIDLVLVSTDAAEFDAVTAKAILRDAGYAGPVLTFRPRLSMPWVAPGDSCSWGR